ncbi:MAG: AraC family transcriptional regulator, partial [bacterium]
LEHINTHYHEDISIRILAEMAHLSVSQFERKFKKTFQLTPVRHIIQVRIKAAKQLLVSTSKKISTIAQDTGFYDHSHFTREFIRETGFTPRDYRTRS